MKAIIGGAYNGKRKYVEDLLKKQQISYELFEGYIPDKVNFVNNGYFVIYNFEQMVLNYIELDEETIVDQLFQKIKALDTQSNVICICTDFGRGIVPIDKKERKVRDTCGRLYQKLFQESNSVIRIWYGIPQILKGDNNNGY
ncbi:adenosylcobinamide kinase [Ureibacillus massiliensis 4400831 = CIP 108448 = CCUG 49529]|uniref:Adenosylcobinamide kinase n=1 Tax=Ureibacillus massiliensis 4400831 = CIP 108448 = CCUG 49529 TaxID=1211035 RepID=A0A0A3J8Q0_9BACL|nr:bifunctional adenosylcobinamide kinase/adenosylcobinamide-phosphate guanylyltransferase [Ureibacillus massiliensis]KGR91563.1 adenosylcobinamide kinase [Ureibacillus massiliensis 4400831 = CIP 108448 = CCUG 49529]